LDDDWLDLVVSCLQVFEVQGPLHVIPGELGIHRLQGVLESVVRDARPASILAVDGERRTDG
jgi:hypothetical protein